MPFSNLALSIKKYSQRPLSYMYVELMRAFSMLVTVGAVLAVLMLLVLSLTTFNLMKSYGIPALAVISIASALVFCYFCAGYKGAFVHEVLTAGTGPARLRDYLKNAVAGAPAYFKIQLVECVVVAVFAIPAIAAIVLLKVPIDSLGFAAIAIAFVFAKILVRYLFSFAFIASALKGVPARASLASGFSFMLKNPVKTVGYFVLYLIVVLTFFIPLLNILALLVFHPILYLAMINFYRSKAY